MKAKSYFNDFWMDMVKNGMDVLGHGTLELLFCIHAVCDAINFGYTANPTLHLWLLLQIYLIFSVIGIMN